MTSSLLNIVDNLAEGLYEIRCKYEHDDKKCETCRIRYKGCGGCLEQTRVKDDLIKYKCLCCNNSHQIKEANCQYKQIF